MERHEKNYIRNWALNICMIEGGTGDFISFTKLKIIYSSSLFKNLLPETKSSSYSLRSNRVYNVPSGRTERFQSSFFPYCACKWNQLDPELQNSLTFSSFKHSLSRFIRPIASPVYDIQKARGLKLLTRLRVGLSHLREHNFRHNFNDTIDPICSCRMNSIESVEHLFLQCPNHIHHRSSLFDNLVKIKLISYHFLTLIWLRYFFSVVTNLI